MTELAREMALEDSKLVEVEHVPAAVIPVENYRSSSAENANANGHQVLVHGGRNTASNVISDKGAPAVVGMGHYSKSKGRGRHASPSPETTLHRIRLPEQVKKQAALK